MAKENKIIKYNLQDEVVQLKKMGYSNEAISKRLPQNHPEIDDIQNISDTSVFRFLKKYREGKVEKTVTMGGDPVGDFLHDFRVYMDNLQLKTDDIYDRAIKISDDIESSKSPDNVDRIRAADLLLKAVNQLKNNQIALMQYGETRVRDLTSVNLKKQNIVNNMFINCTRRLCPKCRKEFLKELELIEDATQK